MTQVPAAAHTLARHVLSQVSRGSPESEELADAIRRVETSLRERLVTLIGLIGYNALLTRALFMAQADNPLLKSISVDNASGNLSGVNDFIALAEKSSDNPNITVDSLASVLAYVIGLLITFIGEDLALRLVRESWPEITPDRPTLEELA